MLDRCGVGRYISALNDLLSITRFGFCCVFLGFCVFIRYRYEFCSSGDKLLGFVSFGLCFFFSKFGFDLAEAFSRFSFFGLAL